MDGRMEGRSLQWKWHHMIDRVRIHIDVPHLALVIVYKWKAWVTVG